MKYQIIYNLCQDKDTGVYYITEHKGWVDTVNHLGYYKSESSGRWFLTITDTGCKLGDNSWRTRAEAVEFVSSRLDIIKKIFEENQDAYNARMALFDEILRVHLMSKGDS